MISFSYTDDERKSIEGIRELIRDGNINEGDALGYTALHWMAIKGFTRAAELLFKSGVNIDVTDSAGQTALQRAVAHDEDKMVDLFIRNGANVNAEHADKRTALHLGSYFHHFILFILYYSFNIFFLKKN